MTAKYIFERSAAPMERVPALPREVMVWRINADLWRSVADGAVFLPKNTQGKQFNRCLQFHTVWCHFWLVRECVSISKDSIVKF